MSRQSSHLNNSPNWINEQIEQGWESYSNFNFPRAKKEFSNLFDNLTKKNKKIPAKLLVGYAYSCQKLKEYDLAIKIINTGNSYKPTVSLCTVDIYRSFGIDLYYQSQSEKTFQNNSKIKKAIYYLLKAKNILHKESLINTSRYKFYDKSVHFNLLLCYQRQNNNFEAEKTLNYLLGKYGNDDIEIKIYQLIFQINSYSAQAFFTLKELTELYQQSSENFIERWIDQIKLSRERLISGNNSLYFGNWESYLNNLISSNYSAPVYIAYIEFCLYQKNDFSSAKTASTTAISKFPNSPDIQLLNLEVLLCTVPVNQYPTLISTYLVLQNNLKNDFFYSQKLEELTIKYSNFDPQSVKDLEIKEEKYDISLNESINIDDIHSGRMSQTDFFSQMLFAARHDIGYQTPMLFLARRVVLQLLCQSSENAHNLKIAMRLLVQLEMDGDFIAKKILRNSQKENILLDYCQAFDHRYLSFFKNLDISAPDLNFYEEIKNCM